MFDGTLFLWNKLFTGAKTLYRDDDNNWEKDIDSSIYLSKEAKEEWIPTLKQRIIAGLVIAVIYMLISLLFWEVSLTAASIGASIFFVLTILVGEKFLKVLSFIVEYFGVT